MTYGAVVPHFEPRPLPRLTPWATARHFLKTRKLVADLHGGVTRTVDCAEVLEFERIVSDRRYKGREALPHWGYWAHDHFRRVVSKQLNKALSKHVIVNWELIVALKRLAQASDMLQAKTPFKDLGITADVKAFHEKRRTLEKKGYRKRSRGIAACAARRSKKGII